MKPYLDLDLPPLFALEIGAAGEEWGVFAAESFGREDDGSYVCAGHGGSPVYLRAVARDGQRFSHVDGGGRKHAYRLRIVDPSQVRDAGFFLAEGAEWNLRAPGAVGRLARAQHALLKQQSFGSLGNGVPSQLPSTSAAYAVYVDESGWEDLLIGAAVAQGVVFSPPSGLGSEPQPPADPQVVPYDEAFPSAGDRFEDMPELRGRSLRWREPVYVGRGAHNVRTILGQLLSDGATPNSGLRRVLAALVGWRYGWQWQPSQHDADGRPTSRGIERFALGPGYEPHLTTWLRDHLSVGWTTDPAVLDSGGFDELVRYFRPPLRLSTSGADPLGWAARRAVDTVRASIGTGGPPWPDEIFG